MTADDNIGRYKIIEKIGSGAWAEVYKALDPTTSALPGHLSRTAQMEERLFAWLSKRGWRS